MKESLFIFLSAFMVCTIALTIIFACLALVALNSETDDCEKYKSYGYTTEVIGGYWDVFSWKPICFIIMEDDIKMPLRDFKNCGILSNYVKK